MARGGKREGAGRKEGSANVRSRLIAEKAMQEGITPLEVMLEAMRELYDAGKKTEAALIAKDCAPYMHPRLNATTLSGPGGGPVKFLIEG